MLELDTVDEKELNQDLVLIINIPEFQILRAAKVLETLSSNSTCTVTLPVSAHVERGYEGQYLGVFSVAITKYLILTSLQRIRRMMLVPSQLASWQKASREETELSVQN